MNLARRQLLERPFRRFADFGGRAGRAEFWMFILVFVVLTELAWLAGYGGAALVPANDVDGTSGIVAVDPAEQTVDSQQPTTEMDEDGTDEVGDIVVKLHRHAGDEDWHLHGRANLDEGAEFFHRDLTDKDRMHHEWRKHWHDHDESHPHNVADWVEGIVALVLLVPLLAVGCRRLHDTNRSGWWQLFVLIPVAGWLVLLIYFLMSGDKGKNRFGAADPA